jgi:phosphohistidine phosphatase
MSVKTLLILRHGKAEAHDAAHDKQRALEDRGKRDATKMGELIKDKIGVPDLIVSSDAARAKETAELAADAAGYHHKINYKTDIYDASLSTLISVVQSLPESAPTVLLVGHNPGFSELASYLANADISLPTAGLAYLKFDNGWSNVTDGIADLVAEYAPKNL